MSGPRGTWSRLETNGLLLLVSQGIVAVAGLAFWALVARLHPAAQVGVAVSLVNAAALIAQVAVLGTNQAVVRFSASVDQTRRILTTALWVVGTVGAVLGVVVGFVVLGGTPATGPWWGLFVVFVLACVVMPSNVVLDSAMLVRNAVGINSLGYLLGSTARIGLLFPFVVLGQLGVLLAHALSFAVTALVSAGYLARTGALTIRRVEMGTVRRIAGFATTSHVSGLAWTAPTLLYPIIALTVLGASASAHLYMALSIASLLQMVPLSSSNALFSEAARDRDRADRLARRSLVTSLAVTALGGVAVLALGRPLLTLFGRDYASEGWLLLMFLVPCQLLVCVNLAANSVAKVRDDMRGLLVRNLVGSVVSLVVCWGTLGVLGNLAVAAGVASGQAAMILLNGRFVVEVARGPRVDVAGDGAGPGRAGSAGIGPAVGAAGRPAADGVPVPGPAESRERHGEY